ncbi:MAG: branched-chain amino acid ABC transporter permease [Beijerinckiaceae bacterium]|nr:branched-chain amino acid ABC transporter permease [Beijerinckiaceae bacterium]
MSGEAGALPLAAPAVPRPRAWLVGVVIFCALALAPLAVPFVGGNYLLLIGSRFMILAIAALSLDLLIGYGGLVSFGHAAFIGIGAYATGILAVHGFTEFYIAIPVAMLAGALFALVTGAVAIRTRGVYFIMITLAFAQMAFYVMGSLSAYGGDDGLTLPSRSLVFGSAALKSETVFFYAVLATLIIVTLALRRLVASRFGRVLQGLRQNRQRMEAMGYSAQGFQLTAYVIAGAIGALAGFLLANSTEFVSPAFMTWQRSGDLIIMVIIGGGGTLYGALVGALAFLSLEEGLSHVTDHWKLIFGPLLVLFVIAAPGGIARWLGWRAHE